MWWITKDNDVIFQGKAKELFNVVGAMSIHDENSSFTFGLISGLMIKILHYPLCN
jgi:hypothetical protein